MLERRVLELAEDIARNFAHLPPDQAAEAVAGHIRSFWDPRMRVQLHASVAAAATIDPVVAAADALLVR